MRTLFAGLAVVVLTFASIQSQAQTFTVNGLAQPSTGTLGISNVVGVTDGTYYAGPFNAKVNGGSDFRVFCGDLLHHSVYGSAMSVSLVDTASLGSGYQRAAQLLHKYGAGAGNDALLNAALQGAIWKSIFPTMNYTDGTTGASALISQYIGEDLSAYSTHATYFDTHGGNQGMIGIQAVPEPASMAALGLGAMGLLKRRKRSA